MLSGVQTIFLISYKVCYWIGRVRGSTRLALGEKNPVFFACYFDAIQREKLLNFDAIFGPYLNEPFFFLS